MKIKKLDELQYIKRGNIFKHCLFTVIGLLLLHILATELGIVFTSQRNALLLIVFFIISLFCVEMIYHGIYPLSEKRQKFLYIVMGLCGIVIIAASVYDMVSGNAGFAENGLLSDSGAGVFIGGLSLAIFVAYIIKSVFGGKNKNRDE
jgi:uncharacterized membrane protein HdeD (DUF308 family)